MRFEKRCRHDHFDGLNKQVVNAFPKRVAMCLGKFSVTLEPNEVGTLQCFENWQNSQGGGTLNGVGKIAFGHTYQELISIENLMGAWEEFVIRKRARADVQMFELHLMDQLFDLHRALLTKTYRHSGYESFVITDPKRRIIHKASVCDRILHRALYRNLYPFFDRTFISDSFSCRKQKGTHKAIERFRVCALQVGRNHTRTCWVLKCDIKQFFGSIDHRILTRVLNDYIEDNDLRALLQNVIGSFETMSQSCVGLPLGNLTSQLFSNVYMNRFDQFVKHRLRVEHYIRYADDFVFLSHDKSLLQSLVPAVRSFLLFDLHLTLHPKKIFLKTLASGVDFLGWTHFVNHRVLRATTKRRILRVINKNSTTEQLASYRGLLTHGNMHRFLELIESTF